MKKKAVVHSNDPYRPQLTLTMSGRVDPFAEIKPEHVIIRGYVGEPLRRRVTVVPARNNPFAITGVKTKHGDNIKIAWKTRETPQGKAYLVDVENTRTEKGRYYDTLYLMTDSALRPRIPIQVRGSIAAQPEGSPTSP
jgi:hypothetical protein